MINPVHAKPPVPGSDRSNPAPAAEAAPGRPDAADKLTLSPAARQALANAGGARQELIERIRSEIQAGTYLTAEKLDVATRRLMQDLHRGNVA